uniref:Uncharacterized protein n=1 Tax=Rhizophora mucronata TaxID=61149 RepID=A0A2P2P747_RHIMU
MNSRFSNLQVPLIPQKFQKTGEKENKHGVYLNNMAMLCMYKEN